MEKFVYIRARVVRDREGILTVKLDDGFGNIEAVIHHDHALPEGRPA